MFIDSFVSNIPLNLYINGLGAA